MERLPNENKKLKGTLRPSREQPGLEAGAKLMEAPQAPQTLSEGGRLEWESLAPILVSMEVLTGADLRLLELCCETLATGTHLERTIMKEGFTISAATGGQKAHPALKALETTRNAAHRMLSDFGLSPKARKYVSKAPSSRSRFSDNPFANLDDDGDPPRKRSFRDLAKPVRR